MRLLVLLIMNALAIQLAWSAPPTELTMFVGEARVFDEPGVRRMAVGDGEVLNATVLDNHQVLVLAEEAGQSTLHLWRPDDEISYSITVIPADTNRLLTEVRSLLGDNRKAQARVVGDKIIVEGNDFTDEEASRLGIISERYPQIINFVSRVGMERMVYTDVKIMEFRRTALRDLGIQWNTSEIAGPVFGVIGDLKYSPEIQGRERISPFAAGLTLNTTIDSVIRAAANNGDAVFLSEPGLTCKSGGEAKFLAGGEIPIPLVGGFGQVSVQFKPYGVKLEVSPVVGESGTIALKVFAELSAIDGSITIGNIPAFLTRRSETQVNLRADETLVISGLFNADAAKSIDKVPGLGDIPIVGELFKSRNFRRNKTELVIFLTPRVLTPQTPYNRDTIDKNLERRQREIEDKKLDK